MQSRRPRRWPSLLDLMVLTAATGLAAALFRPYQGGVQALRMRPADAFMRTQLLLFGFGSLVASCWMVGLLVISARGPRVRRARLARRPGQVACVAGTAALIVGGLHAAIQNSLSESLFIVRSIGPYVVWIWATEAVGPAILGAWIILLVGGRWRPDPGWADRLGRFLGVCWVTYSLYLILPFAVRSKSAAISRWLGL